MLALRGLALSFLTLSILTGCTTTVDQVDGNTGVSPTMAGPAELGYCVTPGVYSPSVTIAGNAQYIRREHFGSAMGAPGSAGLGSASTTAITHPASAHPIRYAEVRVTSSGGGLVQCTETDSSGNFSFTLPQDGATYTISVNSRSLNSHLHASVLNSPDSNTFYSVSSSVSSAASASGIQLTAAADGLILGGAFNILDQLLNANEYLVSKVGTCSSTFTGCLNYDPTLHKIVAYWKKGFNPNDYFGAGGGGLSFYLPGYSRLFILGGINGDTDSSDTDHFDNSIIVHEYGHFLEDNWLKTDSPGGMHDGDEILDPRLAWSEGWGDFIQAAVLNDPHYIDTMGNIDGTTEMIYYVDTETITPASFDYTVNLGEGNFREFAVTRLLWDAVDAVADTYGGLGHYADGAYTDSVANAFNEIWASLSKSSRGYRDPSFAFRNVGLLHLSQIWMQNNKAGVGDSFAQDWSSIRGLNRHLGDTTRYGQALIPTSGSCASSPSITPTAPNAPYSPYFFSVTPTSSSGDTGSLATSDLFLNNRFYHLHLGASPFAAAGTHTLSLKYQDHDNSGTLADLDLYLYNSSARFGVQSDIITYSRDNPAGGVASEQSESLTASLPAGDYLINVNVYTGGPLATTADFNLYLDGVLLCPYDLVH